MNKSKTKTILKMVLIIIGALILFVLSSNVLGNEVAHGKLSMTTVIDKDAQRITVCNTNKDSKYMVISIENKDNGFKNNYYIKNDGSIHKILLNNGTGRYKIDTYSYDLNKYTKVKDSVEVTIKKNKDSVYKGESYYVEYGRYRESIIELIREEHWNRSTDLEEIYNYFKEFEYDNELEDDIADGKVKVYIPNVKSTLNNKKGICIDLASCIACVNRKLGKEARVAVGKTSENGYHAWAEVKEDGEWKNLDTLMKKRYNEGETNGIEATQYF